jgi:hypothetical protein
MSEADERFAEHLSDDLKRYLGPEIALADLNLGDATAEHAHLRATCVYEGGSEVLETFGDTRLDAYNQLILRVAELRLVIAVRHMDHEAIEGFAAAWNAGLSPERR